MLVIFCDIFHIDYYFQVWSQVGSKPLCLQVLGYGVELLQSGLQVLDDLLGDHGRGGEVGGVFEGFVLEPEDVQVDLVPLDQVLVRKRLEPLGLLSLVAVGGLKGLDEVVQIAALERAS